MRQDIVYYILPQTIFFVLLRQNIISLSRTKRGNCGADKLYYSGQLEFVAVVSAWSVKGDDEQDGVQIDLLILRDDNVVNLCEMKFASAPYTISKEEEMRHRIEMLKSTLSPKQTIHLTMITTYGVAYGKHSGIVQKEVRMEDLF